MQAGTLTRHGLILTVLALAAVACAGNPQPSPTQENGLVPVVAQAPSATPTPHPTHTPTSTATPTPTPTPHPLTILSMREREYPGSEVTIVEQLVPGSNYSRYIASYQSEGLTIYALLTIPNGQRPPTGWPVIIFNHGFIPPNVYRTTERYVAYVDWLARSGYITLRSMVIDPDIKAGVIWAGVVGPYPNLFVRPTATPTPEGATPEPTTTATASFNRRWRAQLTALYGTPEENPVFWNSISSNAFLSEVSGPIQMHHGTADHSVPLAASETLYQQMLQAGKPVELYIYEGDDHNLAGSFGLAKQRTIEFFDKYVKGS